ncbi:hypothetical protein SNE40_015663 [Patella caerulea]
MTPESSYTSKVEEWTEREMQLNRLHEEILAKRESLLRTSTNYFKQQNHTGRDRLNITNNATLRNKSLIEDIEELEDEIIAENDEGPAPKFLLLKNNYWSMVKGMLPLWEEAIGMKPSRQSSSVPSPKPRSTPKASRRIK